MQSSRDGVSLTRRQFVAAGAMGGAALAVGCTGHNQGDWDFLNDEQARTLTAICDQIVPRMIFPAPHRPACLPTSTVNLRATTGAIAMPTGTGCPVPMR
jgi:hypothetical protein